MADRTAAAAAAAEGVPSREELHRELMQLKVRIGSMHTQLVRIEAMVRSVVQAHGIAVIEEAPGEARDAPGRTRRMPSPFRDRVDNARADQPKTKRSKCAWQ